MTRRIFVYGTLKRGCCNARQLAGQAFVGEAATERAFRLFDLGGYPGMIPVVANGVSVRGEVWDVDEACRAELDRLEDVATGVYELVPVKLLPPFDKDTVVTYLYKLDVGTKPHIGEEWRG